MRPAWLAMIVPGLANLGLLLFVVILCLGTMEMVVRSLPVAERLGWNLVKPLPDRMALIPPKASGRRVVVVGDSFAEWMEASGGNFARVAERKMREHGQQVEFVNMGEAGSGVADYYRNLVTYGPALKPDDVVIAVYLGNDLIPFQGGLPRPENLSERLPAPDYDQSWRRTLKKSVLLNLAYRQAKLHLPWLRSGFTEQVVEYLRKEHGKDQAYVRQTLAGFDQELLEEAEADMINGWDLATALFNPDYYGKLAEAEPDTKEGAAALASFADILVLTQYVQSLNARPLVLLIPPSPWAGRHYHDYFKRLGYGHLGPDQAEPNVVTKLKRQLSVQGIATLDLLPVLRASEKPAYLERDIHFNALGQELAGHELARALDTP